MSCFTATEKPEERDFTSFLGSLSRSSSEGSEGVTHDYVCMERAEKQPEDQPEGEFDTEIDIGQMARELKRVTSYR